MKNYHLKPHQLTVGVMKSLLMGFPGHEGDIRCFVLYSNLLCFHDPGGLVHIHITHTLPVETYVHFNPGMRTLCCIKNEDNRM